MLHDKPIWQIVLKIEWHSPPFCSHSTRCLVPPDTSNLGTKSLSGTISMYLDLK